MSAAAAAAKRAFDSERWAEAERAFLRVARGGTGDDPGNRQLAEYYAAVAAFHQGAHERALRRFSKIARDSRHLKHDETLLWLAKLATQPDTCGAASDAIAAYQIDEPDRGVHEWAAASEPSELQQQLWLVMGHRSFLLGNAAQANKFLRLIPPDSPFAPRAARCLELLRESRRQRSSSGARGPG